MVYGEKKMMEVSSKKILIIEHERPWELRFYIKGEQISYYVRDQGRGVFAIFVEENTKEERKPIDANMKTYKDFGVENVDQLYFNLRVAPSKYFEMLTGRKVDIGYVVLPD